MHQADPYLTTILTVLLIFSGGQVALLVNVMLKLGEVSSTQLAHHDRLNKLEEDMKK